MNKMINRIRRVLLRIRSKTFKVVFWASLGSEMVFFEYFYYFSSDQEYRLIQHQQNKTNYIHYLWIY
jgi:hypothetical protein